MNIFKLLSKLYLLLWIKSLLFAAFIASLLAIFFGFFSEGWFVALAFWAYLIPTAFWATRKCLRDRKLVQPFDDVVSMFDPNAPAEQKRRGAKLLMSELNEADDEELDEYVDDENHRAIPDAEKKVSKQDYKDRLIAIASLLVKENLLDKNRNYSKLLKEFMQDNYDEYPVDTEQLLMHLLEDRSFTWDGEYTDDVAEFYSSIVKMIAKYCPHLNLKVEKCQWNEESNDVSLFLTIAGKPEIWRFKHYDSTPAENFIIHLSLLLKQKVGCVFHCVDFEEWISLILLPATTTDKLAHSFAFKLREW